MDINPKGALMETNCKTYMCNPRFYLINVLVIQLINLSFLNFLKI